MKLSAASLMRAITSKLVSRRLQWRQRVQAAPVALPGRVSPVVLALVCAILFAFAFQKPRSYPERTGAIVVLAGDMKERTATAASLYKARYAPLVLLTNDGVTKGWSSKHQRNLQSVELSKMRLVDAGVDPEAIVILPFRKSGTIYDAAAVKAYVGEKRIRTIMVVTSDYHVRRSLWTFQRLLNPDGVQVRVVPAPSRERYYYLSALELIKFAYYLLRYGVGVVPDSPLPSCQDFPPRPRQS